MKQSLKALKPTIEKPVKLIDFLNGYDFGNCCRMVCYCAGDERHTLGETYTPGQDAVVLIGPEGDFSEREIKTALEKGFQPVTLGSSRLRTETAALYATTALDFMNSLVPPKAANTSALSQSQPTPQQPNPAPGHTQHLPTPNNGTCCHQTTTDTNE
jgi:hypothetical protein